QNGIYLLPQLWPDALRLTGDHPDDQKPYEPFKRVKNRNYGLYRQWARRNGGCGLWLCRCRTRQNHTLPRQRSRKAQRAVGDGVGGTDRDYPKGGTLYGSAVGITIRKCVSLPFPFPLIRG